MSIENFRGVEETSLEDCGELNVLIGKNNSGKSTVLDAINGFFDVMREGAAVQLESSLAHARNFRRGATARRVRITTQLSLSDDELAATLEFVSNEAPQMKHALDSVGGASPDLLIAVVATDDPNPYSYVERLALIGPSRDPDSERLLLAMSQEAGHELQGKVREARRASRSGADLERFAGAIDPDDYARLRDRGRETAAGRSYLHQFLSRYTAGGMNSDTTYTIEGLLRDSSEYSDFRQRIDSLIQVSLQDAKRIETAPLGRSIDTFAGEASMVPQYALHILATVGEYKFLHLRDRREPVGREEAKRLLALKVRRGGPEVLRGIQETVHSLMGVAIDAFESPQASPIRVRRDEPAAEMDVDEVLVEMNGAGIREALRLVLDNELSNPDLLLVEEPEIHLHPALEMSMLRYPKAASERSQIFVTTHSTNFLDTSEMRNVYLVSREPWVQVRLLDYAEAEEAIPAQLGLRLSSLFMFDRLVFVEGSSDEAVLRELASKRGVNLGRAGVGFVAIGGARNFTHYATEATLAFLTKRRVSMMFVLDRDESTDQEVERLRTLIGDAASLQMLDRREMENYLAIPRPLAAFICWKRELGGLPLIEVSSDQVGTALEEVADALQETTVDRRIVRAFCKPLYPSRDKVLRAGEGEGLEGRLADEVKRLRDELDARVVEMNTVAAQERKAVQDQWSARKLHLVPGDELLDGACQRFGVRFRKERDAQRLASFMEPGEIPSTLVALLAKMVQD